MIIVQITGNQNDLIDSLEILFERGNLVMGFPSTFKSIKDDLTKQKVLDLIINHLPKDAVELFKNDLKLTSIVFNYEPYLDPVVRFLFVNHEEIFIKIGSMFTIGSKPF